MPRRSIILDDSDVQLVSQLKQLQPGGFSLSKFVRQALRNLAASLANPQVPPEVEAKLTALEKAVAAKVTESDVEPTVLSPKKLVVSLEIPDGYLQGVTCPICQSNACWKSGSRVNCVKCSKVVGVAR